MEEYLKNKIERLSDKPGVYFFKDKNETVIYVGKAKNLKKRVKNHFQKPDQHAFDFIFQIADIDFILTDTENAALILEQQFIKKLQPRWNVEWKDDKNYFYIAQTAEPFPRIYLTHQPKKLLKSNINSNSKLLIFDFNSFGPFVSGREVKVFLKEIRKAIPYRSCRNLPKKPCLYQSLGLCVAPCVIMNKTGGIYKKVISAYSEMIAILNVLLRIYQDKVRIGETYVNSIRMECYDISNLSGTLATGSMVVFENGKPNKSQYRKFKIKTIVGQNDVASLKEVLTRRLKHTEWSLPDLIVLDGGKGQLKAACDIKNIPVLALAKIGDKDGKLFSQFSKNYAQLSKLPKNIADLLLQIRDEAHRFAISYNKQRRQANY